MFVRLARNSRSTPRLYTQAEQLGLEAAHLRGPQAQSRDPCRLAGDRVAEEHSVRGHGPPTAHDHFRRRLPRAAAVLSHSGLKANDRTQDFNVDIHQVLVVAAPERGEESNLPARACESSTDSLGPPHVMLAHFAAASPCRSWASRKALLSESLREKTTTRIDHSALLLPLLLLPMHAY